LQLLAAEVAGVLNVITWLVIVQKGVTDV